MPTLACPNIVLFLRYVLCANISADTRLVQWGVSAGNILTQLQTSKGSGMDSWRKRSKE